MELASMEHEEKFIQLLGLQLVGPSSSNCYNILDEEGKIVGFIQYRKVHREKDGKPAVFGYHMVISNDKIFYDDTRFLQDELSKFCYHFDIKNEKDKKMAVSLQFGNKSSIVVQDGWREKMMFTLDSDHMYLNFQRDTYCFHKEEIVALERGVFDCTYEYQLRFCEKGKSLDKEKGRTTFDIQFKESPHEFIGGGNICRKTTLWKDGREVESHRILLDSTLEEEIMYHKRGLESFRYFRKSLNEMLPFKQDIISLVAEQYKDGFHSEYGIDSSVSLFLPELVTKRDKKLVK